MKRQLPLLLTLLAAWLTAAPSAAESYSENFDTSTSLPAGWDFVGGTFYTFDTGSTYYMNSDADYSHSKRNSLCCPVSLSGQYVVSPKMTGQVSFYVRPYRSKRAATLRVFRSSDDGTTVGEEVTAAAKSWTSGNTSTAWQLVSFNLGAEGARLALELNKVYVDDFAGELFEEGEEVRGLSVVAVESLLATDELLGDGENRVGLAFKATVKNVGTVDLSAADDGFTVSLLNADGIVLFTQPIGEAIAAGQTRDVTLETKLEANSLITGSAVRFQVREDLTQTTQFCPTTFSITAFLPQLQVFDADPRTGYPQALTYQQIINFGNICEPLTGTYYVRNAGNAPLVIPTMTAPEGFRVDPASLSVAPGQVEPFTITLEVREGHYGSHEGDVVLFPERLDEYHLSVKGTTRSPEAVYIDFSDQKFPLGWTVGEGWRIGSDFAGTNTYAEQFQYPVVGLSALVSPKVVVDEGESLQFAARAYDTAEQYGAGIALSYSDDRAHWVTVATLQDELTEDFQLFEFDEIPAGQWYLRFQAINAAIDNIWGYRLSTDAPQLAAYDADPATGTAAALTPGTTLDFGAVVQDTTRTFYVQNAGTGTLDIRSIAVPEGFSATPATLRLAAGEAAAVTLTLHAAGSDFGSKGGTVRIEALDTDALEFQVSGITRDPAVFFVDFEQGRFPDGWLAADGWQVTTLYGSEGYVADNHGGDVSALITPLLAVAEADSLLLDAKCFGQRDWYPPTLHVSYSADRIVWDSIADWSEQLTTDFVRFALKKVPAGQWYLRFEGANVELDNMEGYRLADAPGHDVAIVKVSLPEEATVNSPYVASLLLANLGPVAETLTATLQVNHQTRATSEAVVVEAGASQDFALQFMPHEAMNEVPVVFLVRSESGLTLRSDTLVLSIRPETPGVLTKQLAGHVVDDAGAPVAGAHLLLVSDDDVRYSGVSASDGAFRIDVHQTGKDYALTVSREGYAPLAGQLAFRYADIADTTFVLRYLGIRLLADSIPAAMELDSAYTASISLSAGQELAATDYSWRLLLGNQVVDIESTDLAAADTVTFHVPFTPQAEGTQLAYFELTLADGTVLTTVPVEVTVTKTVIDALGAPQSSPTAEIRLVDLAGRPIHGARQPRRPGIYVAGRRKVFVR